MLGRSCKDGGEGALAVRCVEAFGFKLDVNTQQSARREVIKVAVSLVGETNLLFNTADFNVVVFGFLEPVDATEGFLCIDVATAADKPVGRLGEERPG